MNIFNEEYSVGDKRDYKQYISDAWVVSLSREVSRLEDFFSTDLTISFRDIFDINQTRFQLKVGYNVAKQFTGLTYSRVRNKEELTFAFNAFFFNQRYQCLCPTTRIQPFRQLNRKLAAQRCDGG